MPQSLGANRAPWATRNLIANPFSGKIHIAEHRGTFFSWICFDCIYADNDEKDEI